MPSGLCLFMPVLSLCVCFLAKMSIKEMNEPLQKKTKNSLFGWRLESTDIFQMYGWCQKCSKKYLGHRCPTWKIDLSTVTNHWGLATGAYSVKYGTSLFVPAFRPNKEKWQQIRWHHREEKKKEHPKKENPLSREADRCSRASRPPLLSDLSLRLSWLSSAQPVVQLWDTSWLICLPHWAWRTNREAQSPSFCEDWNTFSPQKINK